MLFRLARSLGAPTGPTATASGRTQTHRAAWLKIRRQTQKWQVASYLGALEKETPKVETGSFDFQKFLDGGIQRQPAAQIYPASPFNFTPLRPFKPSHFEADQRAVREVPWESRFDLQKRRIKPRLFDECVGTPRREYQEGMVNGIRVRPVQNPYYELTKANRYPLDNWSSRDWHNWDPTKCYVRGSRRRYEIPAAIFPYKDEIGEIHPPRIKARYKRDLHRQYALNSLPPMWRDDFYQEKEHFMDRRRPEPKFMYKKLERMESVAEAMREAPALLNAHRKEFLAAKPYTWFEKQVHEMVDEEISTRFIRKKEKVPKITR